MKRTLPTIVLLALGCSTAQTPDRRGADGGIDRTTSDTIDEEQDTSALHTEQMTSQQEGVDSSASDTASRSDGGEVSGESQDAAAFLVQTTMPAMNAPTLPSDSRCSVRHAPGSSRLRL